jgi:hypothetical protein
MFAHILLHAEICHVEIDHRGVVHHLRIIVPREDIARASHVCCELVGFVEMSVENSVPALSTSQVSNDKIIRGACAVLRVFQINASDPVAILLQFPRKMTADKTARPADQCSFHRSSFLLVK